MKILVTVKRVIDYNVQVRVKSDKSGVEKENVKMSMNPPDENAVEEALRIKEAGKADEIIILSIGEEKCQETIRTALAMGADRGILVKASDEIEPLSVSKIVAKLIDDRLLIETNGSRRNQTVLSINGQHDHIISIDLGGNKIRLAIFSLSLDLVIKKTILTYNCQDRDDFILQ